MSLLKTETKSKNNLLIKYIDVDLSEEWEETTRPKTMLIICWAVFSTAISYQYIKKITKKKKQKKIS